MKLGDKDKKFIERVEKAMFSRLEINIKDEEGVAYFEPEWEDRLNPSLTISKDDIKIHTCREKLRAPVIDQYEQYFKQHEYIQVDRKEDDSLVIRTKSHDVKKNQFSTLSELEKLNAKDSFRQEQELEE